MKIPATLPKTAVCQRLKELWLHVTYNCNLACGHCLFSCSPEKKPSDLALLDGLKYVKDAIDQGVEAIYITGGEVLLWPYLDEFLKCYYSMEKFVPVTILTNGTLINRERADFLSKFATSGLSFRISLECYTCDTHEKYRGEGSYAGALRGIRHLNEFGIKPWIAYVNKSGGGMDSCATKELEKDFITRLGNEHKVEIAGLKVISAYSKGRFKGQTSPCISTSEVEEKLDTIQCSYGVAVSQDGIFPCPVLVDVEDARLSSNLKEMVGQSFSLKHSFCASCFATGTTCGQ